MKVITKVESFSIFFKKKTLIFHQYLPAYIHNKSSIPLNLRINQDYMLFQCKEFTVFYECVRKFEILMMLINS